MAIVDDVGYVMVVTESGEGVEGEEAVEDIMTLLH